MIIKGKDKTLRCDLNKGFKHLDKQIREMSDKDYEEMIRAGLDSIDVDNPLSVLPYEAAAVALRKVWLVSRNKYDYNRDYRRANKNQLAWVFSTMDVFPVMNKVYNEFEVAIGTVDPDVKIIVKRHLEIILENIEAAKKGYKDKGADDAVHE